MQKSESKEGRSPPKFTQISSRWVGNPGLQDVINNKKAFDYLQAALGNTYKLDTQVGTSVKLLCMALSFQLGAIIKAWPGLLWQTGQPPLVGNLLNCIYTYIMIPIYVHTCKMYTYAHLFIFPQANPSQKVCTLLFWGCSRGCFLYLYEQSPRYEGKSENPREVIPKEFAQTMPGLIAVVAMALDFYVEEPGRLPYYGTYEWSWTKLKVRTALWPMCQTLSKTWVPCVAPLVHFIQTLVSL